MAAPEMNHAAALISAAFVARKDVETPEDAARLYFRCLDALAAAAQEHEVDLREVARKDRQPKPWATSKKTAD